WSVRTSPSTPVSVTSKTVGRSDCSSFSGPPCGRKNSLLNEKKRGVEPVPLIDVTCGARVTDSVRSQLAEVLPAAVSIAVACGDEPYDGNPQPGDVLIRFHDAGPFDRFDLDVLIEVKSKFFADRAE